MQTIVERGWRRWVRTCSRAAVADWLVLWAPVYLIAIDHSRDLFSAMVTGLGTLAIAIGLWAAGRGAEAAGAEAAFAGGWTLLWIGALTTALGSKELLSGRWGGLWAGIGLGGLGLGAVLLVWAWRKRRGRRILGGGGAGDGGDPLPVRTSARGGQRRRAGDRG